MKQNTVDTRPVDERFAASMSDAHAAFARLAEDRDHYRTHCKLRDEKIARLNTELKISVNEDQKLRAKLRKLEDDSALEIESLKVSVAERDNTIKEQSEMIRSLEDGKSKVDDAYDESETELRDKDGEIESLQKRVHRLESQNADLIAQNENLRKGVAPPPEIRWDQAVEDKQSARLREVEAENARMSELLYGQASGQSI